MIKLGSVTTGTVKALAGIGFTVCTVGAIQTAFANEANKKQDPIKNYALLAAYSYCALRNGRDLAKSFKLTHANTPTGTANGYQQSSQALVTMAMTNMTYAFDNLAFPIDQNLVMGAIEIAAATVASGVAVYDHNKAQKIRTAGVAQKPDSPKAA